MALTLLTLISVNLIIWAFPDAWDEVVPAWNHVVPRWICLDCRRPHASSAVGIRDLRFASAFVTVLRRPNLARHAHLCHARVHHNSPTSRLASATPACLTPSYICATARVVRRLCLLNIDVRANPPRPPSTPFTPMRRDGPSRVSTHRIGPPL